MRSTSLILSSLLLVGSIWMVGEAPGGAQNPNANVVDMLDDCDPSDPGYDPTGGCALKPKDGDISFSEFLELLYTPLDPIGQTILIGHPSWRNAFSPANTRRAAP